MRTSRRWFALLLCAPAVAFAQRGSNSGRWEVQPGDALSVLAERFDVSVDQLRDWNELDGDQIQVGQELVVAAAPRAQRRARHGRRPRTHEVVAGDALSVIAERNGATLEQLREWNSLRSDVIRIGQRLVVGFGPAPRPRGESGPTHTVAAGETLSHIAVAHSLTLEALLRLNPELNPDRVREGQVIQVAQSDGRERMRVRVRRGDSLGRIARRHRVRVRDLRRWNRRQLRRGLRAGQELTVWSSIPESTSESVGRPWDGSLTHAVQLATHPSYVIRDRNRAWGTLETTLWIQDGFDAVRDRFERSPRVRVHDISRRRGGRMHGHRSHQSGRDVDISYFQPRCGSEGCMMRRLRPNQLDADRQWALFELWLRERRVEAIFVDYSLQEAIYRAARRAGYSRRQLSPLIQYPRGENFPHGIIRHFPKHRDHAHVRFVCPDTDDECR